MPPRKREISWPVKVLLFLPKLVRRWSVNVASVLNQMTAAEPTRVPAGVERAGLPRAYHRSPAGVCVVRTEDEHWLPGGQLGVQPAVQAPPTPAGLVVLLVPVQLGQPALDVRVVANGQPINHSRAIGRDPERCHRDSDPHWLHGLILSCRWSGAAERRQASGRCGSAYCGP